jgi:hypothetical protein
MNNLTNRILKRYGLQAEKTKLSLYDDVLEEMGNLDGVRVKVSSLIEDYRGLYEKWQRATDEVAELSLDLISAARTMEEFSDLEYDLGNGEVAFANYVEAAENLGASLPSDVESFADDLDFIRQSGVIEFLNNEGADIMNAEDIAQKYIP